TGPTTDSVFYGSTDSDHRYDEAPGTATSYSILEFGIGYCSESTTPVDFIHSFASCFSFCDAGDMVPQYTFTLTGLPGGSTTGGQICWSVDVDLSSTPMILSADCDGFYNGPSSADQFGWSFETP